MTVMKSMAVGVVLEQWLRLYIPSASMGGRL